MVSRQEVEFLKFSRGCQGSKFWINHGPVDLVELHVAVRVVLRPEHGAPIDVEIADMNLVRLHPGTPLLNQVIDGVVDQMLVSRLHSVFES